MSTKIALFDLDGTLALINHRRHLVEGEKKDWAAFYRACVDDAPNEAVVACAHALATFGREVWIVSGRSDEVRAETEEWLFRYGIPYHELIMRPAGDSTPDERLKASWLASGRIPRSRVLCVFDDRDKVVAMWRAEGIPCFQVEKGNF